MASFVGYIQKIYNSFPLEFWNLFAPVYHLIPSSIKFGNEYRNQIIYLEKFDKMLEGEKKKVVDTLFVSTIRNAYYNVPFYRKWMDTQSIKIDDIKHVEDITIFPVINKNIVRLHNDEMISKVVNKKKLRKFMTSGSTGEPLVLYQDASIVMREWAYVNYLWRRIGYGPNSSRLLLTGKRFKAEDKGENWQWDSFKRELRLNISVMSEKNLQEYSKVIEKYKPDFIHGYMSAIVLLCKYIDKNPLIHSFKGVIAISETILPGDREYVERVLNTRLYSFYGHTERLALAGECEKSQCYHIEPTYGYVELLDAQNNPITKMGTRGRIIATGFLNSSMPLIRYDTGDVGEWELSHCECGRTHKLLKRVYGRIQEVFVNCEGAIVPYTIIENIHSDVFSNILRYQFIQNEKGKVILRIQPGINYNQEDCIRIKQEVCKQFSNKMDVKIEEMEYIAPGQNGKMKLVIQNLNISEYDLN